MMTLKEVDERIIHYKKKIIVEIGLIHKVDNNLNLLAG